MPNDSGDASPEPPESILVLEDMRPLGYRVKRIHLQPFIHIFELISIYPKPAHFKKGLNLMEAESAIKTISVVHALSLGLKLKHKVDLNERYPVSVTVLQIAVFYSNDSLQSSCSKCQGPPKAINNWSNKACRSWLAFWRV